MYVYARIYTRQINVIYLPDAPHDRTLQPLHHVVCKTLPEETPDSSIGDFNARYAFEIVCNWVSGYHFLGVIHHRQTLFTRPFAFGSWKEGGLARGRSRGTCLSRAMTVIIVHPLNERLGAGSSPKG